MAMSFAKQLYLFQLICTSTVAIIIGVYASDDLFKSLNESTYALQIVPEIEVISDEQENGIPFSSNVFVITIGFAITIFLCSVLYVFNPDQYNWY